MSMGRLDIKNIFFCQHSDQILLRSYPLESPTGQQLSAQSEEQALAHIIHKFRTYTRIPCSKLHCCLSRADLFIMSLKGDNTQCHDTFLLSNLIQS